jgi:hypothetical protein
MILGPSSLYSKYMEPHYQIAYVKELLSSIRELAEEDRFLYLSYTNLVNWDYGRIVNQVIIGESALQRMRENGVPEDDKAYQRKLEDLERFKGNLQRETDRFLGYAEMKVRLGEIALERMDNGEFTGSLRWIYYDVIYGTLELEELVDMPEEELFLYLRFRGPNNYGFRRLVDEMVDQKSILTQLRSTWTEDDRERFIRAEQELESIKSGLRKEANRILKVLAFQTANSERALWIAKEKRAEANVTEPADI